MLIAVQKTKIVLKLSKSYMKRMISISDRRIKVGEVITKNKNKKLAYPTNYYHLKNRWIMSHWVHSILHYPHHSNYSIVSQIDRRLR